MSEISRNKHFTHCLSENHRGLEFCCEFCNVLLNSPNIWYFRSDVNDRFPSHACCWGCMMTMQMED